VKARSPRMDRWAVGVEVDVLRFVEGYGAEEARDAGAEQFCG
jgi:hypothetical protein